MSTTKTTHQILVGNAYGLMRELPERSVNLVVTSPPYPMIEMWDEIMAAQNKKIGIELANKNGNAAFELMHQELDKIWDQAARVLSPGWVCVYQYWGCYKDDRREFFPLQ